jgi:hypothetical protein
MELPDELPSDIDYDWYVREANAILDDIGVGSTVPWGSVKGRTGTVLAHLPTQKTLHKVDIATGVAACDYRPKSMRMSWVEKSTGMRVCKACERAGL